MLYVDPYGLFGLGDLPIGDIVEVRRSSGWCGRPRRSGLRGREDFVERPHTLPSARFGGLRGLLRGLDRSRRWMCCRRRLPVSEDVVGQTVTECLVWGAAALA
jgi:hypothetical protein